MKTNLIAMAILLLTSAASVASPIDNRDFESILIENPTLRGINFCGSPAHVVANLYYICSNKGYTSFEILEKEYNNANECWATSIVGTGSFLSIDKSVNTKITKVRCSRFGSSSVIKPPDSSPTPIKPIPPIDKPIDPQPPVQNP